MDSKGLSFIVSDKCNITCDFCAPDCGPKRKGHLDSSVMINAFDQLSEILPISNVVFTGGEPTLFLRDVIPVMDHIKKTSARIPVRIVTNAYWGKKSELAASVVGRLKDAGLSEFNFSVDSFHQKYIDMQSIKGAVDASVAAAIPVLLSFKTFPGSDLAKEDFDQLLGFDIPIYNDRDGWPGDALVCISIARTVPIGRGSADVDLDEWVPKDTPRAGWAGPCQEVLKNITIQANGAVSPCCGLVERDLPVFYMGDIRASSLREILIKANNSVIYNWLALEGPEGLMAEVAKRNPDEKFLGRYLQNCQLCQEIFSSKAKKDIVAGALADKVADLSVKRLALEALRPRDQGQNLGSQV